MSYEVRRATAEAFFSVTIFCFGIGLFLSGCGTVQMYPGPERSASETATLEVQDVIVFAFDNQPPGKSSKWSILPGEHAIQLSHNVKMYGEQIITYVFTAEPGRRYVLGANYSFGRSMSWRPWVKDAETGEVIGGKI
jgi:hypothetical protein